MDGGDGTADLVINKRFVSEAELEERRKRRQEEWEKVRKPEDPKENMVRGLDEDETHFLDEVSRQQELLEKQRREEELKELNEYRSTLTKVGVSMDPKKETEKKLPMKSVENKNKFSQAKLLAGAVKHRSSDGGNSVKRLKLDTDHDEKNQEKPSCVPLGSSSVGGSTVHCPSAAVCIGILPGLGAYSGSSDSESSSDSEGTINSTGKIVSSVFRGNSFFDGP
ncbi:PSME3-interacting protein isoform X2 [Corvus cornix cornix]|uniref:protein FAM192A isoform X2 n=1 Tax=Corvus brachyrhynchos TaxID=85066 RepID=UPI00081641D4|nr:PREDICTED: protein FAM192A isoform X2 [Corvus brachyrhynchos]XP_031977853.1 PSME3-interacting protein isoform X2 [Corvus moneduloides]XP_039414418.1 PSME3-interacting protein isoform X2 [Corvus cornix cornix]XP_041883162.1 PSME3-interacting protein isoform X2 [Corvus kubaryi]XP_048172828.1 PSME3-interacting protein isoform X2 [Corvus hawaiiensis]